MNEQHTDDDIEVVEAKSYWAKSIRLMGYATFAGAVGLGVMFFAPQITRFLESAKLLQ